MELKKILAGIDGLRVRGDLDLNVTNIDTDSRKIKENGLFIAIKGFDTDGHKYMKQAIENGATVIVASEDCDKKLLKEIINDVTLVLAPNTRFAAAICACNFFQDPSTKLTLIGITGTKGKTTTSFMIKEILEKQGKKVGLIGTIAIYIGNKKLFDSDRTTPDSIQLQAILAKMVQENCDVVVMEVSSQSLKLDRVAGCDFDIGVFTNFSKDHISEKEHPDMQDYFNSKTKLFTMCKKGFANADDLQTIKLFKMSTDCEIKTYGIDNYCNLLAKDITVTNASVDFKVKLGEKNERVKVGIPGRFSVYNALAAIGVCQKLGCEPENIKQALETVKVPGRSELVDNKNGLTIMIDYAHSPESLENILKAVKSYTKGRVISVFGCGGDRDSSKRAIMGEISGRIADYTIITSDNPRTEDPEKIVKQIEEGIKKTKGKYVSFVDRTEAIAHALKIANKNDIIVLAGKGHEPYQEINGVKYDYDERKIVKDILDGKMSKSSEQDDNKKNTVKSKNDKVLKKDTKVQKIKNLEELKGELKEKIKAEKSGKQGKMSKENKVEIITNNVEEQVEPQKIKKTEKTKKVTKKAPKVSEQVEDLKEQNIDEIKEEKVSKTKKSDKEKSPEKEAKTKKSAKEKSAEKESVQQKVKPEKTTVKEKAKKAESTKKTKKSDTTDKEEAGKSKNTKKTEKTKKTDKAEKVKKADKSTKSKTKKAESK